MGGHLAPTETSNYHLSGKVSSQLEPSIIILSSSSSVDSRLKQALGLVSSSGKGHFASLNINLFLCKVGVLMAPV